MKKVEATIKAFRLEAVRAALVRLGVTGMTVSEVRGFGRQKGHTEHFRGTEYSVDLLPKVKVEVLIPKGDVGDVIDAITRAARTNQIGDGKIYVSHVSEVLRIRTGERGEAAL